MPLRRIIGVLIMMMHIVSIIIIVYRDNSDNNDDNNVVLEELVMSKVALTPKWFVARGTPRCTPVEDDPPDMYEAFHTKVA